MFVCRIQLECPRIVFEGIRVSSELIRLQRRLFITKQSSVRNLHSTSVVVQGPPVPAPARTGHWVID